MSSFRTRDFLALIVAVILTRMAWRDSLESFDASIFLSFYVPTHGDEKEHNHIVIEPAVLDVDGDGTAEALAVVASAGPSDWKLQILDLKPGFGPPSSHMHSFGAFRPKILLESKPLDFKGHEGILSKNQGESDMYHSPEPLVITTGHVMMRDDDASGGSPTTTLQQHEQHEITERTRKYFCGTDWHDASQRCGHPCPGGTSEECPGDEKCYADTPCDYYTHHNSKRKQQHASLFSSGSLSTTPLGSVPSLVTLWEHGILTLHSITAEKPGEGDSANSTSTGKKKKKQEDLELRLMWVQKPLKNHTLNTFETHKLEFIDAITAGNQHGMIVITAVAEVKFDEGDEADDFDEIRVPCVLAIDAKTGEVMWETLSEHPELQPDEMEENMLKPLYQGTSSLARRRSYKPSSTLSRIAISSAASGVKSDAEKRLGMLEANCMHAFRRSMLISGALPFMHWSDYDISSRALHFEHQPLANDQHKLHRRKHKHHQKIKNTLHAIQGDAHHAVKDQNPKLHQGHQQQAAERKLANHHTRVDNMKGTKSITGLAKMLSTSWLPGYDKKGGKHSRHGHHHSAIEGPHRGRPNVIVTHHADKLEVRSLKNGRSLCHLSLWEETMYADLNHDGILDSVNVITGQQSLEDDDATEANKRWVSKLVKRIQVLEGKEDSAVDNELKNQKIDFPGMCHLQVLSGVPSKEELYAVDICGPKRDQGSSHLPEDVEASPPLVVEPLRGRGKDILIALNTGVVTRLVGMAGQIEWQWAGAWHITDFPTWDDPSIVSLARIDSYSVIPRTRPVLLAGENSMVLLSARQGKYLAHAVFPQPTISRPLIMDMNGDGTTDVLVQTSDAFWGYQVHIRTGGSLVFRTIVGLLLMGLMLALLRNRFGPHPGKRSTDA